MSHRKKRWSDYSGKERVAIVIAAAAQIALHGYAWRDLLTRPADEIKGGSKLPWGVALLVSWVGPIAYLTAGREKAAR